MKDGAFDTIIVGAGTAGAVLAARLSEDRSHRVLLVEAGGRDRNPLYRIPLGIGKLRTARRGIWRHDTEPEPHLDGRRMMLGTGKVLGGSAAINGMVHMRPAAADLDAWARVAGKAWSAAALAPIFARIEDPETGTLAPCLARITHPLDEAFLRACAGSGIAAHPELGIVAGEGAGPLRFEIRNGRRYSTPQAYLGPVRRRSNVTVLPDARALRIVIESGRALGVSILTRDGARSVYARRDVILAAGALHSPQLLMLSGIGPAAALRAAGIAVHVDLPGVGGNLQNHVDVALRYTCPAPVTLHSLLRAERILPAMAQAWLLGSGPATRFPGEAAAFIRTRDGETLPDILCHLVRGLGIGGIRWPLMRARGDALDREGFSCRVMLLRPESRGRIALRSADPLAPPLVAFGFLSREAEWQRLITGVRRMREVFAHDAFERLRDAEIEPGPAAQDDASLAAWIRARADMQCHPVGTCAMGDGPDAVVDPALRVHGVEALRVVDASVMPSIVGANTFATTVAIAERAADLMR